MVLQDIWVLPDRTIIMRCSAIISVFDITEIIFADLYAA